jgi:hypothetical protein
MLDLLEGCLGPSRGHCGPFFVQFCCVYSVCRTVAMRHCCLGRHTGPKCADSGSAGGQVCNRAMLSWGGLLRSSWLPKNC